ncbi:MAG: hypothetical protein KDJ44_16590 [Rhodoblastus sp.]|nr:hypothetical protein [Rhodoblastus sp.]
MPAFVAARDGLANVWSTETGNLYIQAILLRESVRAMGWLSDFPGSPLRLFDKAERRSNGLAAGAVLATTVMGTAASAGVTLDTPVLGVGYPVVAAMGAYFVGRAGGFRACLRAYRDVMWDYPRHRIHFGDVTYRDDRAREGYGSLLRPGRPGEPPRGGNGWGVDL